ncbi:RtcB family protein [Enhygromyxa salina]|uniref:tRNA-splicing ligase RtcB n=1 Tax=Enhygromyxa salina TaxID=215803 RepID=A0A2S9YJ06_9BACT|nr:RtcB family protein [Enhygromyxa salina]PRQ05061.1 RNA-splicing ligase RtcB [Enhygromyxa salina]
MGKLIATPLTSPAQLPKHATVMANDQVWMEAAALDQLARVANFEGCTQAVGMPDLHPGPTVPIGVAIAFKDRILPALVGGDAGCGARVITFAKLKLSGDRLERRVRENTETPPLPNVDPTAALQAVWRDGPRGLCNLPGVPTSLVELAQRFDHEADHLPPSGELPEAFTDFAANYGASLGSVGGGNHFLELSQIDTLFGNADAREQAKDRWGLTRGGFAVLAHSGSRGLGRALALRWGQRCLTSPEDRTAYLSELAGACRFARANRLVLCWRMLNALGVAKPSRLRGSFDLTHNDVNLERASGRDLWVHRKGCAPAHTDQPTVVLGTRGTASYVMRGHGHEGCLCSVAHGAGRRMTRSDARAKIAHKHRRKTLTRTACGSRVICDDKNLLYEEHPEAYKDIEVVVDSLEQAGAATRVAALLPMVTVKR